MHLRREFSFQSPVGLAQMRTRFNETGPWLWDDWQKADGEGYIVASVTPRSTGVRIIFEGDSWQARLDLRDELPDPEGRMAAACRVLLTSLLPTIGASSIVELGGMTRVTAEPATWTVCFFVRDLATRQIVHYEIEQYDSTRVPRASRTQAEKVRVDGLAACCPPDRYEVFEQVFSSMDALYRAWPEVSPRAAKGWIEIEGGEYEVGLDESALRQLAKEQAAQAREAVERDPNPLHGLREAHDLETKWGNPDYLFAQWAFSMPAHRVVLQPFAISRGPVTRADAPAFRTETHPGDERVPLEHDPLTGLSWEEAAAVADGMQSRLPTEAEWEVAFRVAAGSLWHGRGLFEWCADPFEPYPGADLAACARVVPPPSGWAGTRVRRTTGVMMQMPQTALGRDASSPKLKLRDTTFRLVRL